VLGTFGRGFYVLDDYSPLRHLDEIPADAQGYLFPVQPAFLYRFLIGSRGSGGSGRYAAQNPPYGANLNLWLPAGTEASQGSFALSLRDSGGEEVRRLEVPVRPGLQRIVWDLRETAPEPEEGERRPRQGPEVAPGTFTAALIAIDSRGRETELSPSRLIRVMPLELDR